MPARLSKLRRKTAVAAKRKASRPIKDPARRLKRVIELLEANLGTPTWDGPKDALEVLVLTILSQNTTDPNALRAYENLVRHLPAETAVRARTDLPRDAFGRVDKVKLRLSDAARAVPPPDWPAVVALPREHLAELIRAAGLPGSKSASIQEVLRWLWETASEYRLEAAINRLGIEAVTEALSGLKGIGVKTVSVTLIEALGADLCPVDTHVHRIINRLGIVETKSDRDRTFRLLKPMIPAGKAFSLHHNLLTLGRTLCNAKKPDCANCFLHRLCPSAHP